MIAKRTAGSKMEPRGESINFGCIFERFGDPFRLHFGYEMHENAEKNMRTIDVEKITEFRHQIYGKPYRNGFQKLTYLWEIVHPAFSLILQRV